MVFIVAVDKPDKPINTDLLDEQLRGAFPPGVCSGFSMHGGYINVHLNEIIATPEKIIRPVLESHNADEFSADQYIKKLAVDFRERLRHAAHEKPLDVDNPDIQILAKKVLYLENLVMALYAEQLGQDFD